MKRWEYNINKWYLRLYGIDRIQWDKRVYLCSNRGVIEGREEQVDIFRWGDWASD